MTSVYIVCALKFQVFMVQWPVLPICMQLTLVSWYVASMLCCHCWMFGLVMLCRCKVIPLKYSSFVWHNLFGSYRSIFLHEISGISWLTLWLCWFHSCWMFILIAEYGLVHRGDCICNRVYCMCFRPWPFNLFFSVSFPFWLGGRFMAPTI